MLRLTRIKEILLLLLICTVILSGCAYGRSIYQGNNFESKLTDGEFRAESKYYNSYGYKPSLTIWVNKGIITRVNFTETDHNNILRLNSDINSLKWNSCEYSYPEILEKLYSDTILSQGESVDSISGATKTIDDYKALQKELIQEIKSGYQSPIIVDELTDTYVVQNEIDPVSGSQEVMEVQLVKGKINSITVKEVTNNAAFYAIGRVYQNLADISEAGQSLDPVVNPEIDSIILDRYNNLLGMVKSLIM